MPPQATALAYRWFRLALLGLCVSGCLHSALNECSTADSTYTCCLKKHSREPQLCDGLEGAEVAAFRPNATTSRDSVPGEIAAATTLGATAGWAISVLIQGSDDDLDELQDKLDEIMEDCADRAEQSVNQRRLKGKTLSSSECNEETGRDDRGRPLTRAMMLGNEKHTEAFACLELALGRLIPGYFLIEQRYRFDSGARRVEPIGTEEEERLKRTGRTRELEGTLKPDVVIHSGKPAQVRFVYDFKFPCVKGTPASWRVYTQGPYRDLTQKQMYEQAFGVAPGRVEPGRKGVLR